MSGIERTRLTKRLARACVLRDTRRVPENTLAGVTRSLRAGRRASPPSDCLRPSPLHPAIGWPGGDARRSTLGPGAPLEQG
jgi:hypothetical protein